MGHVCASSPSMYSWQPEYAGCISVKAYSQVLSETASEYSSAQYSTSCGSKSLTESFGRKRSQGYQGSTNLVNVEHEAGRAHRAAWAAVIAAHRITSSAFLRRAGGMVIPRVWAALRLITSWNSVGCCTTRSAGSAPLRSLATYVAA